MGIIAKKILIDGIIIPAIAGLVSIGSQIIVAVTYNNAVKRKNDKKHKKDIIDAEVCEG